MQVGVKFSILCYDFFNTQFFESIFKLTADLFHTSQKAFKIRSFFCASFRSFKVIKYFQELANNACSNETGELFFFTLSTTTEVVEVSLQTHQAVVQLGNFFIFFVYHFYFFFSSFSSFFSGSLFPYLLFVGGSFFSCSFFNFFLLQNASSYSLSCSNIVFKYLCK